MTEEEIKQAEASTETEETQAQEESTEQSTKLVPTDMYLKTGIHVGTKFKTKHMKKFIYKTRPDGLSVLDVEQIDERIQLALQLLRQYEPKDILVVSRRENGWKPVKLLEAMTGMRVFAGRYPPGILTNSNLEDFIEAKIMVVVDAWADRNAVSDAIKRGIPVIALCDTNNQCNNIDFVVPCNNKGRKSLGLFFYLLARDYMIAKGLAQKEEDMQYKMDDFLED
ncbi:MAG: 30S ribosomal protein S2 [Candidatus Woesearchaeota archaeon]